jgi:hypothetical protein
VSFIWSLSDPQLNIINEVQTQKHENISQCNDNRLLRFTNYLMMLYQLLILSILEYGVYEMLMKGQEATMVF